MKNCRYIIILFIFLTNLAAQESGTFVLFHKAKHEEEVGLAPTALLDALSLLYYGSSGETEKDFRKTLFPGISRSQAAEMAQRKQRTLAGYRSIGSLWFSNRVQVRDSFLHLAKSNWEFHTEHIPMRSDPKASAQRINDWYRMSTNGYYDSVVDPYDFISEPDVFGVIVTAFVSPWKDAYFESKNTSNESFHLSPSRKIDVKMMKAVDSFEYYENEDFQGLKIQYASESVSLFLLLPKDAKRFDSLVETIDLNLFTEFINNMNSTRVNVWLPKVQYMCRIRWHELFRKSDLPSAFIVGEAEFKNINGDIPEPLFISSLVQDVMVRWDETGTEARSITLFSMDPFGAAPEPVRPPDPIPFIANHPFIYFIVNQSDNSNDVLFSGIIDSEEQMLIEEN